MVDVFISYPRSARAKVEPIKAKLDTLGLDCFFDLENIDGGANFPDIIDRALRTSKAVLCCWSPLYFERPWCMIECRDGLAREIMVPVSLERFERFAPPADMRHLNYLDLTTWDGGDAHEDWNRTLHAIGKLVGRELAPPLKRTLFGLKAEGPAPAAPEAVQALADILSDLRATWAAFPAKDNIVAVERFLSRVRAAAPGSGLEFEVEHHFDELGRRDAERRGREEAEAEAERQAEEARRARVAERLRPGAVWRDPIPGLPESTCPEMVTMPPGKFLMGSPKNEERWKDYDGREEPEREVQIEYLFALSKHTVTFAEWDAAIAAGANLDDELGNEFEDEGWGRLRRPVINVSWDAAKTYIAWLNGSLGLGERADAYRLPSEAEWEYACRAGTTTPFSFGETISTTQANYHGHEYRKKTMPVGSFPPNPFGLHDMHGNVSEWCEDTWHPNYEGAPTDGSAWIGLGSTSRVLRGGAWYDRPFRLRSASRDGHHPAYRVNGYGLRLARTLSA